MQTALALEKNQKVKYMEMMHHAIFFDAHTHYKIETQDRVKISSELNRADIKTLNSDQLSWNRCKLPPTSCRESCG